MDFQNMSTGLIRKVARGHNIRTSETGSRSELIRAIQNVTQPAAVATAPRKTICKMICSAGDAGMAFMQDMKTLISHEIR